MSKRYPKVILIDLIDALDAILDFTSDIDYEQFLDDRKTRDAVYRNVTVTGEAANRLPEQFLLSHPEIEWQKIISTRNAIMHGYDEIDDQIVWNIIRNILPELKLKLNNLFSQL